MCDLLPQFVHDALDKVEKSLSLPVLVVLAICTIQFAITHSMHIACIVKDILRKRARKANRCPKPKPKCPKVSDGCSLMDRIKALFNSWFNCKPKCPEKCPRKSKPLCKRRCPKKKCNSDDKGGDSDDDEFDDGDDLLGLEDL